MNDYRTGLRHGYEDHAANVLKILDSDVSDARKLEQIRMACESAKTMMVKR